MSQTSSISRRHLLKGGFCACCVAGAGRSFAAAPAGSMGNFGTVGLPTALELGLQPMRRIAPDVWVAEIAPAVWLHTTTHLISGEMYPANGLVLARPDGVILIDAGWTPQHAETLLDWADQQLKTPVRLGVATHFHEDRTGGVEALRAKGVHMVAHPLTVKLARENKTPVPEPLKQFGDTPFALADDVELWLPGGGHTQDNIVVWLTGKKVLFGGCFLKSTTSTGLGNIADAVMQEWSASVVRTRQRYSDASMVVPGHGTTTGDPIGTTLELLERDRVARKQGGK